jgi:hypothetical protein
VIAQHPLELVRGWVVLVTGGTVIEYPPELYLDPVRATDEAERWAWIVSGAGWAEIERPFPGRWEVGDHSVRLVEVPTPPRTSIIGAWVGTFWDRSGVPDPEALLLEGREDANRWVREPPAGAEPAVSVEEQPWFVAATYDRAGEEEYAVAHRLKLVS